MATRTKDPVIAIEEHFWDRELSDTFTNTSPVSDAVRERLFDFGQLRLKEMDAAGVDMQVISHAQPSAQRLPAEAADKLARGANDRLHAAVSANPERFAGLAALPTADPDAAAAELERCVSQLGFKGAMIHGLANGAFLDERRFWPIFARAEALDVPIYLHPAAPHPAVREAYYEDYVKDFRTVAQATWGFTIETGTQALRLVLSGVFEAHPRLKIVLGHLGESLPFLLWRIDHALARPGQKPLNFREVFTNNFYVTTSGFFSNPALLCTVMELGVDRILFAIDWPFVPNDPAVAWLDTIPLSREDRAKIAGGNAKRLLRL